ncbi:hypothetical protein K438DRAFT_1754523 [Mycena galopus ATCC 62051]|nr:hypothetical protein K438DRAFT_1754523 [Mycena galopus ATCC 62051]
MSSILLVPQDVVQLPFLKVFSWKCGAHTRTYIPSHWKHSGLNILRELRSGGNLDLAYTFLLHSSCISMVYLQQRLRQKLKRLCLTELQKEVRHHGWEIRKRGRTDKDKTNVVVEDKELCTRPSQLDISQPDAYRPKEEYGRRVPGE